MDTLHDRFARQRLVVLPHCGPHVLPAIIYGLALARRCYTPAMLEFLFAALFALVGLVVFRREWRAFRELVYRLTGRDVYQHYHVSWDDDPARWSGGLGYGVSTKT